MVPICGTLNIARGNLMAFIKIGPKGSVERGIISRNTIIGKNPRLLEVEGSLKDATIEDNVGVPPELWAELQSDKRSGMSRTQLATKYGERLLAVGANVATILSLLFRSG